VHHSCKNIVQLEDRRPVPVRFVDTVSITLLHSDDFRAVMVCGQPVGFNSDANALRGLNATIRGVWLKEDGHPVTGPYNAQQEASFSFFRMLKSVDTVAQLIPGWTEDFGKGVYNLYLLVHQFCRTTPGDATKQLFIAQRSTTEQSLR
jgi:hypothetical protein